MAGLAHVFSRLVFHAVCWLALFLLCHAALDFFYQPVWLSLPLGLGLGLLWHGIRQRSATRPVVPLTRAIPAPDAVPISPFLAESLDKAWQAGRRLRRRSFLDAWKSPADRPLFLCFSRDGEGAARLLAGCREARSDGGGEFTWHSDTAADWLDLPFAWRREGREAWRAFLRQLPERLRGAPAIGVVVTMEAGTLLSEDETARQTQAELLRRRLNELAETAGRRLSAYVFVDGMEALYGWRALAALAPKGRLREPVGCLSGGKPPTELIGLALAEAEAFCRIPPPAGKEGISDRSTLAIPAMLAPDELRRLRGALADLCGQAFSRGNGIDARGAFFGSCLPGRDGGGVIPPLAAARASFVPAREPRPGEESWFTEMVTRRFLPADAARATRETCGAAAGKRGLWLHAGTAGLLLGTLVLCWLMTFSFVESRRILLSAAGKTRPPAKFDELRPYFELAALTRLRSQGWPLPRFGMAEPLALADELERRYSESYFDLKTVPGVEQVQDAALSAARSRDPVAMGNSLLMLLLTGDGIRRALDGTDANPERSAFLRELAVSLSLASADDMRQMDAYFAWAGRQDWMPETRDALAEFERHLLGAAAIADWLPAWLDTLPPLRRAEEDAERGTTPAVRPAWTWRGYVIARELLSAVSDVPERDGEWRERREAALEAHRRQALAAWLEAAEGVWDDTEERIADATVHARLRRAAFRDDPAARFAALACAHLLPMFDDGEASGLAPAPEVAWLRLWREMAGAETAPPGRDSGGADKAPDSRDSGGAGPLGAMAERVAATARGPRNDGRFAFPANGPAAGAWADDETLWRQWRQFGDLLSAVGRTAEAPDAFLALARRAFQERERHGISARGTEDRFAPIETAADALTRALRVRSGGAAWDTLSPAASLEHLRRLAVRQAALHLDDVWLAAVYTPCMLTPGGMEGRHARLAAAGGLLEQFLTGEADGFWIWRDGDIAAAAWDGLEFPFSEEFLDFCNRLRQNNDAPPAKTVALPLAVRAVGVVGAVREHPVATEFTLASGGASHTVAYRNYAVEKPLIWTRAADNRLDGVAAAIRVRFPSLTASLELRGGEGLRRFASMLEDGRCVLFPEDFGKAAPALRRLGVERIVIQATMENTALLFREMDKRPLDPPRSIVRPETNPASPVFHPERAEGGEKARQFPYFSRQTADENYGKS